MTFTRDLERLEEKGPLARSLEIIKGVVLMVLVDGKPKTIEEIVRVAKGEEVAISGEARDRILDPAA
jgi:hypothetical protein